MREREREREGGRERERGERVAKGGFVRRCTEFAVRVDRRKMIMENI